MSLYAVIAQFLDFEAIRADRSLELVGNYSSGARAGAWSVGTTG